MKAEDSSGNKWRCPLDAVKNFKDLTQEELDNWVELDVVIREAGDIEARR